MSIRADVGPAAAGADGHDAPEPVPRHAQRILGSQPHAALRAAHELLHPLGRLDRVAVAQPVPGGVGGQLHRLDAREADPARARRPVVRDVDVERVAVADVEDLGLPHLAPRAGYADDARAALRLRRGGRERKGAAEQQQEREQAAHDQTRTPLVAAKLRRRQRRARRRNPRCTSRSARTTRRGMRRRRLRFHPGARSTTRPSRVTASIRCSDPRARSTRPWARKPATMTTPRTSHMPGGSGAPAAPVAAVTRPVAVSTARTPSRPSTNSVVTSAGARYSSWLVRCLSSSCSVLPSAQRVRRVGALPQEPVAVAREAQPVELGVQAHLGDRSRLHAGRADLCAQRGLGVGERLEGIELAGAQQPRARAQVEREERVDALGEARDGDLVHRLVEAGAGSPGPGSSGPSRRG